MPTTKKTRRGPVKTVVEPPRRPVANLAVPPAVFTPEPEPVREVVDSGGGLLRGLEIFLAVEELRSFSAAARKLSVSQPTVTQRIQALEETVGSRLLNRGAGGVSATEAGRSLKNYAERMLALRDEMLADLKGRTELKRGRVRLASCTTAADYVMPDMLRDFRTVHPAMRVDMVSGDSDKVLQLVDEGVVEIGIVGIMPNDSALTSEPFLDDELVLAARPDHPALQTQKPTLGALRKFPWVLRENGSGTRRTLEHAFACDGGAAVEVAMELDSTEAVKRAVRAGEGIAVVSARSVANEVALNQLATRHLAEKLARRFYLVKSRDRDLSAGGARLWQYLVEIARAEHRDAAGAQG